MNSESLRFRIPGRSVCIGAVRRFFGAYLRTCRSPPLDVREVRRLELALHESLTNAAEHGCAPGAIGRIDVEIALGADRLTLRVRDEGEGFDLAAVPEPVPESLPEGGYGLFIIRETMDLVEGERTPRGFVLSMTRLLPPPGRDGEGRRR